MHSFPESIQRIIDYRRTIKGWRGGVAGQGWGESPLKGLYVHFIKYDDPILYSDANIWT